MNPVFESYVQAKAAAEKKDGLGRSLAVGTAAGAAGGAAAGAVLSHVVGKKVEKHVAQGRAELGAKIRAFRGLGVLQKLKFLLKKR